MNQKEKLTANATNTRLVVFVRDGFPDSEMVALAIEQQLLDDFFAFDVQNDRVDCLENVRGVWAQAGKRSQLLERLAAELREEASGAQILLEPSDIRKIYQLKSIVYNM